MKRTSVCRVSAVCGALCSGLGCGGGAGTAGWTRPVNFPPRPPGCTLPHSSGLLCHVLPMTLADRVTVARLSFPICRMGVVLVSRGEGDTECAEEPCRQVVTVSLSVSQPPGSTTPESVFGDTQSTPGTPRGSRWRVHPSGGHRSPERVPSGGHGPAAPRPGPSGSGAHNEGHSRTRPACGTASQLPCNNQAVVLGTPAAGRCPGSIASGWGCPSVPSLWGEAVSGGRPGFLGQLPGRPGHRPLLRWAGQQPQVQPCLCGGPLLRGQAPLPFLDAQVGGHEVGNDEGCRSALQEGRSGRWVPRRGCGSLPGGGDTQVAS